MTKNDQRLHDYLTEEIDRLGDATSQLLREINKEYKLMDDRAQANATSFRKISELNERYHEQYRKLLTAKKDLLDINHGPISIPAPVPVRSEPEEK